MAKPLLAALLAGLLLTAAATAQEHSSHDADDAPDLPAICLADTPAQSSLSLSHSMSGDAAHVDLMDGMAQMNEDMAVAGTAADIDVAFVCSMIPHHRGAIDMAKAELAHGDDPWAREMAQAVITAQEKEIAEMMEWLKKQPR